MLVLWDIDGTLVTTASAGRRAIDRAFLELHGWEEATRDVRMDGRTDPWIVDEVFRQHGLPAGDVRARGAVLLRYVQHLAHELRMEPPAGRAFGPLPGVVAGLQALIERGCTVALLTGNIEAGAKHKLERLHLWRYFPFGAPGDHAPEGTGVAAGGARRLG